MPEYNVLIEIKGTTQIASEYRLDGKPYESGDNFMDSIISSAKTQAEGVISRNRSSGLQDKVEIKIKVKSS